MWEGPRCPCNHALRNSSFKKWAGGVRVERHESSYRMNYVGACNPSAIFMYYWMSKANLASYWMGLKLRLSVHASAIAHLGHFTIGLM